MKEFKVNMKKQYNGIDIIKFFMAICVVMIHLTPFGSLGSNVDFAFDQILTRAAVPFFFVASGFFLKMKLDRTTTNKEYNDVVLGFVKRIAILYGIWTLIYSPCIIFWIKQDGDTVLTYLQKCIFDGSYLHLWYLPSVLVSGFLAAFLVKKIGINKSIIIAFVLYLIGLLDTSYYGLIKNNSVLIKLIGKYEDVFITTRNGLFFGLIFVLMGFLIYERRDKYSLKNNAIMLIVAIVGLATEMVVLWKTGIGRSYEGVIFSVFVVYFLMIVAQKVEIGDSNKCKSLRRMGEFIYLSHCMFDFSYSVLCFNILHRTFNDFVRFGYTLVLSIAFSIIILKLSRCNRFKWLNKIY